MKIFPLSQKNWATAMRWVGIIGLVAAVFGAIVSQVVINRMETGLKASLYLARSSLAALETSTDIANSSLGTVKAGLAGLNDATSGMAGAFDEAQDVLLDIGNLVEHDLSKTAKALDNTMPGLIQVASMVDGAMTALNQSPIALPYSDRGFTKGLQDLNSSLKKIPGELTKQGRAIKKTAKGVGETAKQVEQLADQLKTLQGTLDSSVEMLNSYKDNLKETTVVLEDALAATTVTMWMLRIAALLIALSYGLLMVMPLQFAVVGMRGLPAQGHGGDIDIDSDIDGEVLEEEHAGEAGPGLGSRLAGVLPAVQRLVGAKADTSDESTQAGDVQDAATAAANAADNAADKTDGQATDEEAADSKRAAKSANVKTATQAARAKAANAADKTDGQATDEEAADSKRAAKAPSKPPMSQPTQAKPGQVKPSQVSSSKVPAPRVQATKASPSAKRPTPTDAQGDKLAAQRQAFEDALAQDKGQTEAMLTFDVEALGNAVIQDGDLDIGPEGNAPRRP